MDNSKEFQLMLDGAIRNELSAFECFDRTKNVQDQLQEMLDYGKRLDRMIQDFYFWEHDLELNIDEFKSMEQLWLAFCMYKLYQKIWDGNDWKEEIAK